MRSSYSNFIHHQRNNEPTSTWMRPETLADSNFERARASGRAGATDAASAAMRCMQEPARSHCVRYPSVPSVVHATARSTAGASALFVLVSPVVPVLVLRGARGRKELWAERGRSATAPCTKPAPNAGLAPRLAGTSRARCHPLSASQGRT